LAEKNYLLIDKKIIEEGSSYNFSIYYSSKVSKGVECFKDKGAVVSTKDLLFVEKAKSLFVEEREHFKYKSYYKSFLMQVAKELNKQKDAKQEPSLTPKNPTKLEVMYQNFALTLNTLFQEPLAINNYKESKKIVNTLVDGVCNEEFTLKKFMSINSNDFTTLIHSLNVTIYALSLGLYVGFSKEQLQELGEAALLHDLGKSQIDDAIINKEGVLTPQEQKIVQMHPIYGASIGLKLGIKNKKVLQAIKYHHEKYDGSGYPQGLSKDKIPLYSRIISVCDIFDALTSKRSYTESLSTFDALKMMKNEISHEIDLRLLGNMIKMFR